jgi:hypothetical protein
MGYENATTTKLLCTHCVACGRALVDAVSVEMGIGPECRNHFNADISEEVRTAANKLVFAASIAAVAGKIDEVRKIAEELATMGLDELAEKVGRRFVNANKNAADISIEESGNMMLVRTPYRRGEAEDFKAAWRAIPGRRWDNEKNANEIPTSARPHLWALLKRFFPGKYGKGPKGIFRIPKA